MVRNTKVVPYLDLPIQHCDDAVLKAMNRRGGRKESEDAIARLRAAIPGITLRTTLIAGFPGETEEQYAELCDFVKTVRFDRLGCFAYSAEENTVAAKMPNQIDEETKQRRADHSQHRRKKFRLPAFALHTAGVGVVPDLQHLTLVLVVPEPEGVVRLQLQPPTVGVQLHQIAVAARTPAAAGG